MRIFNWIVLLSLLCPALFAGASEAWPENGVHAAGETVSALPAPTWPAIDLPSLPVFERARDAMLPVEADESDTLRMEDAVGEKMPVIAYRFNPKHLILPASLITVGAVGTAIDGMNDFHLFHRKDSVKRIHVDDYMEWGMLGWVFVCDLMGKEKHSWVDQFCLLAVAEGLNAAMTRTLKYTVKETRPDGRPYSFPSGHTSNAFLGAHLAYKEFKDSSPVLAYSGYVLAAFVAGSRLYNNRHWVADVVAGAGFGILSVELAYGLYFPLRNAIARKVNRRQANRWVVVPSISTTGGGLYLSYSF